MPRILILTFLLFQYLGTYGQNKTIYSEKVEFALQKAGKNRIELEKALWYFYKSGDSLKFKAAEFLISNMDIHYSHDYHWVDLNGDSISYDEGAYNNFKEASLALLALRRHDPNIVPEKSIVPDVEKVSASYLIANINQSFAAWKKSWAKDIPFTDFCEYILPYRVSIEPLQNWRTVYENKYHWITDSSNVKSVKKVLSYVAADYKNWFTDTFGKEEREEPLPRLGALQLLSRKKGACEDIADLEVFTLRSQGIPAALNIIPYWATATGNHYINSVFDSKMKTIQFDVTRTPVIDCELAREPSKVLRVTYSKQPDALASYVPVDKIPEGFMRTVNYFDITDQYWQTTNLTMKLNVSDTGKKTAFACVFNNCGWKPTWYGNVNQDSVTFNNMPKGVVYLPVYYSNGEISAAGSPVGLGFHHRITLTADTIHKSSINIPEKDKYLVFRANKRYQLYYWKDDWELIGEKIAGLNCHLLSFDNVPKNALLLILPEYSKGLERPFIITEDGKQEWW